MKLNNNGSIAKFYRWSYGRGRYDNLPPDLCSFFWKTLFALLIAPFSVWTLFPQRLTFTWKDNCDWNIAGRLFGGILTAGLFVLTAYLVFVCFTHPYEAVKTIGIIVGATLALLAGGFVLFVLFHLEEKESVREFKQVVKEKFRSAKDGYCPRITWTDK